MAGNSIGIIRAFYNLGVRYVGDLVWPWSVADKLMEVVHTRARLQQCFRGLEYVENRIGAWRTIEARTSSHQGDEQDRYSPLQAKARAMS